ncbi:MAG: TonB-dependent receptor [Pyrinomonadaceae bacterium]|nr:TonB-dependent receptor [Pyrinomonadaceae bacterium]
MDSVEEFIIQTSTYAAEFGRQPGAQISILTRSGTNDFHGSVFEYYRKETLDANDWFVNSLPLTALQIAQGITKQPRAPLRLNQFGGVFGGPLYLPRFGEGGPALISGKDRTFFFFSYEGVRLTQPQTRITDVPTLATRQAAPAGLRPFLNAYPLPNGPVSLTDPTQAEFSTAFSDPSDLDTYSIRIDHIVNKRLQIFGRYNNGISNNERRASSGDGNTNSASSVFVSNSDTRTLTLGAISPFTNSLVNDFRFNYSRNVSASDNFLDTFGGAVPFSSSALFASTPPPFTVEDGLFAFLVFGGRNQSLFLGKNTTNTQKQVNIVDHLSVVKGSHNLRFGADYRSLSPEFAPRLYVGVGAYFNFTDVLAGRVLQVQTQQSQQGSFFFKNLGLYAQDTWRATPRLTLTYGLRWDVDSSPTLSDGLQPFAVTSAGFADPTQLALAPSGSPLFKTTYNNFAPRVGVTYQLRQTAGQETIVRGGFGVFYDLASQYAGQLAQVNQPPFGVFRAINGTAVTTVPDPVFGFAQFPIPPNQAVQPPINLNPPLLNTFLTNPELVLPRSLQWNLAVEQSLGTNQALSVSYVASKGSRLLQQEAINGAVNPIFSNPILIDNTADSDYHSMQVQFQRRLSQGLQALASYTWAHSIDSASTAGFSGTNNFSRSRPDANRASSDFDIRHAFNAAVSYGIPAPFKSKALRGTLGGWSTDTIFIVRTAPPLTVTTFGLLQPFETATIRPDVVPGVPVYLFGDQFPGGKALNPAAFARPPTAVVGGVNRATRQGTASRNAIRGFGAWQVDFSLRREFKLGERVRLQFRGEFFNVLNHPNFGGVNTGLGFRRLNPADLTSPFIPNPSPTFGQATSMLGRSLLGTGGVTGGFSPLFQIGGPRSTQLSLKLVF